MFSHYRAHGIHSPFVYHIVRDVITTRRRDKRVRERVREYRKSLKGDKRVLDVSDDYGTGAGRSPRRSLRSIVKNAAVSEKYGMLLGRLVGDLELSVLLELGTSLGVSTMYMAEKMRAGGRLITIEGSRAVAAVASEKLVNYDFVEQRVGRFEDELPRVLAECGMPDFVFVDGNHCYEATMRYFTELMNCYEPKDDRVVTLVFDDIRGSTEMKRAWREICEDERVSTSITLFRMGIVFLRTGCQREHFNLLW